MDKEKVLFKFKKYVNQEIVIDKLESKYDIKKLINKNIKNPSDVIFMIEKIKEGKYFHEINKLLKYVFRLCVKNKITDNEIFKLFLENEILNKSSLEENINSFFQRRNFK